MKNIFLILALFILSAVVFGQTFTEVTEFDDEATSEFGDYDNDGDLDIITANGKIFRNNSGSFTKIIWSNIVSSGCIDLGDYDNDGDLDILFSGFRSTYSFSEVFKNDNGVFSAINSGIVNVDHGDCSWGDYDNDGDLDILIQGHAGSFDDPTLIYRNDSGIFTDIDAGLSSSIFMGKTGSWGDYDNDGDLDILMNDYPKARIYQNDSGSFTNLGVELAWVSGGTGTWGDYDSDGDLDILLGSKIYRNDLGIYTDINADLPELGASNGSWGDYDNDGDLDVLFRGYDRDLSENISQIYKNENGNFTAKDFHLLGIQRPLTSGSKTDWGDYDNDGDLDILMSGYYWVIDSLNQYSYFNTTKLYRNNSVVLNSAPNSPSGLVAATSGFRVDLSWDKATDNETAQDGLSYNLYVGSIPNLGNIKGCMSNISSGYRKVVTLGNTSKVNSYELTNIPSGTYYWSVQAVDNCFTGSEFAPEQTFVSTAVLQAPIAVEASDISTMKFNANWVNTTGAKGYYLDVSTDSWFTSYLNGYENLDVGNVTSYEITGLNDYTDYYYRVRAYNINTSENSNIVHIKTLPLEVQGFSEMNTTIPNVDNSFVAWGDYDSDGDLDILLTGDTGSEFISKIYRNDSGVFTDINAGLQGVYLGSVKWFDYDNDGDLDILLTGHAGTAIISKIYRNDSGQFFDIEAGLLGVYRSSVDCADYDSDGDLDILLTGIYYSGGWIYTSKIYRNDSCIFTDINANLAGVGYSSVAWVDYDNDGDLDILLTGCQESGVVGCTKIYQNDAGIFDDIATDIIDIYDGEVDCGDYDNDGDSDILITGYSTEGYISKLYRNDLGEFTDINADLTEVRNSSVDWGDCDNDGDLDIILTGYAGNQIVSEIYHNESGVFSKTVTYLDSVWHGSSKWGDFDNDGDLDLLLTGLDKNSEKISKLYRNISSISNTPPESPLGLTHRFDIMDVTFNWDKATDNETPQDGLSYNLYIGTESTQCDIVSPMSETDNGYRKIVSTGNTCQSNSWTTTLNESGTYYWSVQAVDHCFAGSEFATEGSFVFVIDSIAPDPPIATNATNITVSSFTANWEVSDEAVGYRVDVATDSLFTNFVSGYENLKVGNVTAFEIVDLESYTDFYFRVRAYNVGNISENSNIVHVKTLSLEAPIAIEASDISALKFNANWENTLGAKGYYLDVSTDSLFTIYLNGYENLDVGNVTSFNINGLTQDTEYYYRIRAYSLGSTSDNSNTINEKTLKLTFTEISTVFDEVKYGANSWGDYDNDSDMDLLITGITGTGKTSKIYRNDSGIFTNVDAGLIGVDNSSVDWGDYDNDGDLDIVITGRDESSNRISKIYNNDNGIFTDVNAGLVGVCLSSVAWGDYDNDGDLDLLLSGTDMNYPQSAFSYIYQNDSGVFTNINAGLEGVCHSSVDWGDYDNDGDLDIVICGFSEFDPFYLFDDDPTETTKIYRNNGDGTFNLSKTLLGVADGSVSWGDHDNDGDLDILLTGMETWWGLASPDGHYTIMLSHLMIYENDGLGNFTSINHNIASVEGSAKWFDHDNDGDLDVIVSGLNGIRNPDPNAYSYYQYNWVNKIYTNDGSGNYSEITEGIDQGGAGQISVIDIDNDHDLDFLLTGNTLVNFLYQYSDFYCKLYRNESEIENSKPNYPKNLRTTYTDSTITFSWDKATDNETSQEGLSYNICIGTQLGVRDVQSPMSDTNTGKRKIVELGNAGQNTSWAIKNIDTGRYYWSVQAIDHAFAGSEFAAEQTFVILSAPSVNLFPNGTYMNVYWSSILGATSYNIYTSFDPVALFPDDWELAVTGVTGTIWTDRKTRENKKFYKVVAVVEEESKEVKVSK